MARKSISKDEKRKRQYDIFPQRFTQLMHNKKPDDLSTLLGVSRQMVNNYMNGKSNPDWRAIPIIANFLGVSADYLLGTSNVKTCSLNARQVCETYGLDNDVIEVIEKISKNNKEWIPYINILLNYLFVSFGSGDDMVGIEDFVKSFKIARWFEDEQKSKEKMDSIPIPIKLLNESILHSYFAVVEENVKNYINNFIEYRIYGGEISFDMYLKDEDFRSLVKEDIPQTIKEYKERNW